MLITRPRQRLGVGARLQISCRRHPKIGLRIHRKSTRPTTVLTPIHVSPLTDTPARGHERGSDRHRGTLLSREQRPSGGTHGERSYRLFLFCVDAEEVGDDHA